MASTEEGQGGQGQRRWSAGLRNTWQRMNQWGDEFERRHFDGNFVQSVVGAPTAAFQAMSDWGDDFERRHFEGDFLGSVAGAPVMAGEVISEAVGQLVDTVDSSSSTAYPPMAPMEPFGFNGEMQNSLPAYCAAENSERLEEREVSPKSQPSVQVTDSSGGPGPGLPSGPGVLATGRTADEVATFMASLPDGGLEEVARDLQLQLEEEYGKRHGRVEALRALKAHLLKLPGEIAEEQRLVDLAAGTRAAQGARVTAAGRALQTLKEHHHHLQDHQAALLEEREQLDAAKAAAAAAVERQTQLTHASCVREWARDGPETEALKEAKVELAQLLAEVDEARLHRRQELKALYQAVEATEAENKWHRAGGHDAYTAPGGSFGASLRRLFAVARGRRDPYPTSP